jgi:hypothetical protein
MKKQLAENMRRFATKNLNEQIAKPAGTLRDALKQHIIALRTMYTEFNKKYVDPSNDERLLDLKTSKKITLGMIAKIKVAEQQFHDEIKKIYNM